MFSHNQPMKIAIIKCQLNANSFYLAFFAIQKNSSLTVDMMMNEADREALALFFPSSSVYAKFDTGFTVSNVIDAIDEDSQLQNMFDSIEIIYQQTLNTIVEETKGSNVKKSDYWKGEAVKKLNRLQHLPELNEEQFDLLSVLFKEGLHATTLENNKLPNIVLAIPSKRDSSKMALSILVCRSGTKSKSLPLRDLARYHTVMPNLKSIRLYMLNMDINDVNTTFSNNNIEEIDIILNAYTGSTADLLMHIFKSYESSLKTLKLERNKNTSKPSKQDEDNVEYIPNSRELNNSQFKLYHLETLVIKYFYQSLPTAELIQALLTADCKLKHASCIGLNDEGCTLLSKLLDASRHTLESLAISSLDRPDSSLLQGLHALKSLSLFWSNTEQHVDVIRFLMLLPQLISLELGYEGKHGVLSHDVVNLEKYTALNKLAFINLIIKGDEFSHMHEHIPHLTEIGLYNCKFGAQRTDMEANLSLKDYSLKSLLVEDGHLYYSKKDKQRSKRAICKYIITMESNVEMTGYIAGKTKATSRVEENISMLSNTFSYVCVANNATTKPLPVLNINVQLLEVLQLDKNGLKAAHFRAVQDEADQVINSAIEDQASEALPSEILGEIDQDYAAFAFDDYGMDLPELEELEAQATENEQTEEIDFFADDTGEHEINEEGSIDEDNDQIEEDEIKNDQEVLEHTVRKRRTESDSDYTSEDVVSSSESDSSDEEESTNIRRSTRLASTIPQRTRGAAQRKNKRHRLFSDESPEEEENDDERKKTLKKFMYKVRNYRAVIRIPAK